MPPTFPNRRQFLKTSTALGTAFVLPSWACQAGKSIGTSLPAEEIGYAQQPLPYAYTALEPAIDALTMEIHYSRHAAAYAKSLSEAVAAEGVDAGATSLNKLLSGISRYSAKMRNNGGGHYNHEFFWRSLRAPVAGNKPSGIFLSGLEKKFGSFEAFQNQFADAGKIRFGSGWAWLLLTKEKELVIGSTPNQDNPLMDLGDLKGTPLLGLDVWEHAYYLKYQNRRADYIQAWWNVVNWDKVAQRWAAF